MTERDHDLLRRYATEGSQAAFAELVRRHVNLVYSAARRQVQSSALAEEIAQSVFLDLSRNASRIKTTTPLIAWLHVVTRRTAIGTIRRESRRQAREQSAAEIAAMKSPTPDWSGIEPLLDEAVESLPETDRIAILLRFFENKSLQEVGSVLGTSDDAAQKRVTRAIESLRAFFLRRGIAVTGASLATNLSANALQIAPAGLGVAISSSAAALAGVAASVATSETSRVIVMTSLQKSLVCVAFLAVAGTALYESVLTARQSDTLLELRAHADRTAADLRATRTERDIAASRLKTAEQQINTRLAQARAADPADPALVARMTDWLNRIDWIKQVFTRRPELNIPELRFLKDDRWFAIAGGKPIDSDQDVRKIAAALREEAENLFLGPLHSAMRAYVAAHEGVLPASPRELTPYLAEPIDPAILDRYEMSRTGPVKDLTRDDRFKTMAPKSLPDPEFGTIPYVGPEGSARAMVLPTNLTIAVRAFATANSGQRPTTAAQLKPFLKWPLSDEVLEKEFPSVATTPL